MSAMNATCTSTIPDVRAGIATQNSGLGHADVSVHEGEPDELLSQIGAAAAAGDRQQLLALARKLVGASRTQDCDDEDLLTLAELAQDLRVSTRTVWRVLGSDKYKSFPKPFRVGRQLRWRRADVEKYKAQPNTRR